MILLETTTAMLTDTMLYLTIAIIIIAVFVVMKIVMKAKQAILENGPVEDPETNFFNTFFIMGVLALVIIFGLKYGLESGLGNLNTLMFSSFPYVAFAIFIIGSIYRYMNRGYQVTSLSSQFLEGKQLFWGSQPFHWGIMVIFFGHLLAFTFPSTIIAWNGEPVRLLILEISSLAFALSALLGLILLIKRRLTSKRVLVVTNKMDMLVYIVLLTQLLSGIGVAVFARWGSTWFASSLTPYLRSVFAFNPDIAVVSALPWFVQIHIISAFFIIAIIPFTRFVHFLVAPIDYIWRNYQLVIWNWNHKSIRKSTRHTYGKKIKNH